MEYFHSVKLLPKKCIGCTDCIKQCPTEAIRVRNAKAIIINERCIDCGTCVAVCQQHAKKATTDELSLKDEFKYKVALPAPTIYGQFKTSQDINKILTAIKKLGFDDVFEVSMAAELVTEVSQKYIYDNYDKRPFISSACPAVVRLISSQFPSLIPNILPVVSPMEAAARSARKYLTEEKGIPSEDIGIFFISPCGAKVTDARNPVGFEKSNIDGVISIQDIYIQLRTLIKSLDEAEPLSQSSTTGIDWAASGGESRGLNIDNAVSVDGISNVMKVFEAVENDQLPDVDFIEGLACVGGCIGGSLAVKNSFIARNFLNKAEKIAASYTPEQRRSINYPSKDINMFFEKEIIPSNAFNIDQDMSVAIKKLEEIKTINDKLPHIDCGSCGAPTCKALAEDVVRGTAVTEDCIFMLRQKVRELAEMMVSLSEKLPPSFKD